MAMTEREMLNAVVKGTITDEVIEKAKERLVALDTRNEKRKSAPSKSVEENKKVKADIVEFLKGKSDFVLGTQIAEEMGINKNKVSSLCPAMVKDGVLVVTDVSVPKVGKRKAYKLA